MYYYKPMTIKSAHARGNYSMFEDVYQNDFISIKILEAIKSKSELMVFPILFLDAFDRIGSSFLELKYHDEKNVNNNKIRKWLTPFSNLLKNLNVSKKNVLSIFIVTPHINSFEKHLSLKINSYKFKVNFIKFVHIQQNCDELMSNASDSFPNSNFDGSVIRKYINENLKIYAFRNYQIVNSFDDDRKLNITKAVSDSYLPIVPDVLLEEIRIIIDKEKRLSNYKIKSIKILEPKLEDFDEASIELTISYIQLIIQVSFNLGFFENDIDITSFKTRFRIPIELMIRDKQKGAFDKVIRNYKNEVEVFNHLKKVRKECNHD